MKFCLLICLRKRLVVFSPSPIRYGSAKGHFISAGEKGGREGEREKKYQKGSRNQAPTADDFPSITESPQDQTELENDGDSSPIFFEDGADYEGDEAPFFLEDEIDIENEDEEEPFFLDDEDEEDEEYMSYVEYLESLSEEEDSGGDDGYWESEVCSSGDDEDEACSSGDEVSEGGEWSATQIDGLFCSICMESWTTHGDHHICCLPCGHIYGMSCIERWLKQRQNQGKCPQCKRGCTLKDVRKLFASWVVAIEEEAQKRIQSLENKCASLEKKRARWSKKEAKWRQTEVELKLEVQHLREVNKNHYAECKQQLAETKQQVEQMTQFLKTRFPDYPNIPSLSDLPLPPQNRPKLPHDDPLGSL